MAEELEGAKQALAHVKELRLTEGEKDLKAACFEEFLWSTLILEGKGENSRARQSQVKTCQIRSNQVRSRQDNQGYLDEKVDKASDFSPNRGRLLTPNNGEKGGEDLLGDNESARVL